MARPWARSQQRGLFIKGSTGRSMRTALNSAHWAVTTVTLVLHSIMSTISFQLSWATGDSDCVFRGSLRSEGPHEPAAVLQAMGWETWFPKSNCHHFMKNEDAKAAPIFTWPGRPIYWNMLSPIPKASKELGLLLWQVKETSWLLKGLNILNPPTVPRN